MKAAIPFRVLNETGSCFLVKDTHLYFFFFLSTGKIITIDKVMARIIGWIYVPTDFDTIEKAFSGVKTAEKGIKQGLSRSITDSESPFSLYSVVDFCRSKVRRHRGV